MDWAKLAGDIADAATIAFSAWRVDHRNEQFYAFVLYTDGDCYTVEAAANSLERHQASLLEANVNASDVRMVAGHKWHTGEWAYEGYKDERFNAIYRNLEDHRATLSDSCEEYAVYKLSVQECMIAALKRLRANGFFANMGESIVVFVSSTDDDEAQELENRSAKQLNSDSVYLSFLDRYPSVGNGA
jgi:hypothetical protein